MVWEVLMYLCCFYWIMNKESVLPGDRIEYSYKEPKIFKIVLWPNVWGKNLKVTETDKYNRNVDTDLSVEDDETIAICCVL